MTTVCTVCGTAFAGLGWLIGFGPLIAQLSTVYTTLTAALSR